MHKQRPEFYAKGGRKGLAVQDVQRKAISKIIAWSLAAINLVAVAVLVYLWIPKGVPAADFPLYLPEGYTDTSRLGTPPSPREEAILNFHLHEGITAERWERTRNQLLQKTLDDEDLPSLYRMLRDARFMRVRPRLASSIALLGHEESAPVLIDYLAAHADWEPRRGLRERPGRTRAHGGVAGLPLELELLGIVGGDAASAILREALSEEGARALSKKWIARELPDDWYVGSDRYFSQMRGSAAKGLVFTRIEENVRLVEELHAKLYSFEEDLHERKSGINGTLDYRLLSPEEGSMNDLFGWVVEALAARDCIKALGWEDYLNERYAWNISCGGNFWGRYDYPKRGTR